MRLKAVFHCSNIPTVLVPLCAMLFAICASVEAQQLGKIPRIGFLSVQLSPTATTPNPLAEAFRQGLRDLGHVEGKNISVEYRYAEGKNNLILSHVAELVQAKLDVLVITSLPQIRAAKQATKTTAIVMVTTVDPVETGLIESLARPGGNITGLTRLTRDLSGKRLELLKETVPGVSRVGVLGPANAPAAAIAFKDYEAAAHALKIQFLSLEVRRPNPDYEGAFRAAAKGRANAVITISEPLARSHRKRIADLAIKNRLPSLFEGSTWVEAGGLMSYSATDADQYRRAAVYVDKILKGAKPADLPVEKPTKFELVINLKTAKQIGVTIPQSVLYRADKVIR